MLAVAEALDWAWARRACLQGASMLARTRFNTCGFHGFLLDGSRGIRVSYFLRSTRGRQEDPGYLQSTFAAN